MIDHGHGTDTLFLHGNPDTAEVWRPLIGRLAGQVRCLAPDLPGFAGAPVPAGFDWSLASQAAWVEGALDRLAVRGPINLVVHDVGGPYGLAWACRHPERVRRLAIFNTVFNADYRWHAWARIWRTRGLGEASMALMNPWLFARELRRGSPGLDAEHIRQSYAAITPETKRMVLRWYRAMDPEVFVGWQDELVALAGRVPSLVLWGDRDPYLQAHWADRFGARTVQHFPDRGHWLMVEAPDEVAGPLARLLA